MIARLRNKFICTNIWALVGLLATVQAVAGAYPMADTCRSPEPPVITGSATFICRNETVTLTATGCNGTVVWSNGNTGDRITIQPQQTTKYTAICRAPQGCISCFADVWKITVNTPEAPVLTPSATLTCPNDLVTITATGCTGLVHWPDMTTGSNWSGKLTETTVFKATCEQNKCISNPSRAAVVQLDTPAIPIISADLTAVCAGQSVRLTASGCVGTVRWSDGSAGLVRSVTPYTATTYRAICQTGSCQSDSSETISITVRSSGQNPDVARTLSNGCPFQTADLSKALIKQTNSTETTFYTFRTGPSLASPAVQSPGAVGTGTYYIFGRDAQGCYTDPMPVTVTIDACSNAIPPCLSNPATVAIRLDSLNWAKGVVYLQGKLGGSAQTANWQSAGGGLFVEAGPTTRYLLSETDRQRGMAVFTLTVPDPDGSGACVGASAQLDVVGTTASPEVVGLSKNVSEPVWIVEGTARFVELTYRLTAVNLGKHALTHVQVADNLDAVFTAMGGRIQSVAVRADSNFVVNPAYTGRGADTTLLLPVSRLPVGSQGHIWLTVRTDVSQASTLTFVNKATVQAIDANGGLCRDQSTNGTDADPDKNGNPADNNEPTVITLHSLQPGENETVFIPEGFSPNGDGINDRFALQRVPAGVTVQVEVYNRWGNVVYQSSNYKNDWDGTANQGIKVTGAKADLPDGTYYYQIRLSDGREFVRFLTLVR